MALSLFATSLFDDDFFSPLGLFSSSLPGFPSRAHVPRSLFDNTAFAFAPLSLRARGACSRAAVSDGCCTPSSAAAVAAVVAATRRARKPAHPTTTTAAAAAAHNTTTPTTDEREEPAPKAARHSTTATSCSYLPSALLGTSTHCRLPLAYTATLGATDVRETASHFVLEVDVPGLSAADVRVQVSADNVLTISGTRTHTHNEATQQGRVHRSERTVGSFTRRFALPPTADAAAVVAAVDGGVLRVRIAKRAVTAVSVRDGDGDGFEGGVEGNVPDLTDGGDADVSSPTPADAPTAAAPVDAADEQAMDTTTAADSDDTPNEVRESEAEADSNVESTAATTAIRVTVAGSSEVEGEACECEGGCGCEGEVCECDDGEHDDANDDDDDDDEWTMAQ